MSVTGVYEHQCYGTITISYIDGQLSMRYNGLVFVLKPMADSRFLATLDESYTLQFPISFQTNHEGMIVSLSAPFEPGEGAKPLVFTRKEMNSLPKWSDGHDG
ncbi:DUF3471 domain-containing protein [Brevibacillus choshinensis]|uniref:DUF3471 domain-containing protein n=1 Tax=Brevibacillus choshinensis TaxID=54911 RepID=UPI002E1A2DEF|nr:DUF3471 domain-containing protein [Brevibacillus choshinensis]